MPDYCFGETEFANALLLLALQTAVFQRDSVSFVVKSVPMVLHATENELDIRVESLFELFCFFVDLGCTGTTRETQNRFRNIHNEMEPQRLVNLKYTHTDWVG